MSQQRADPGARAQPVPPGLQKRKAAEDEAARRAARRTAADAKVKALQRGAAQTAASAVQLGVTPEDPEAAVRQQSRDRARLIAQQDRELAQVGMQAELERESFDSQADIFAASHDQACRPAKPLPALCPSGLLTEAALQSVCFLLALACGHAVVCSGGCCKCLWLQALQARASIANGLAA